MCQTCSPKWVPPTPILSCSQKRMETARVAPASTGPTLLISSHMLLIPLEVYIRQGSPSEGGMFRVQQSWSAQMVGNLFFQCRKVQPWISQRAETAVFPQHTSPRKLYFPWPKIILKRSAQGCRRPN